MISILIPVYNRDARTLVRELVNQAEQLGIDFEIICLDNHSIFFRDKNIQLKSMLNCTYEVLPENIGQAAIRNKLAESANYEYLLFIDSDLKIDYHNYLRNYVREIPSSDLVCGGIHYLPWPPTPEYLLHWLYGIRREIKKSMKKSHFLTCNFMIRRSLFNEIRFNEDVNEYGHENTLFGIELNKLKINRNHVFSPVAHNQLDSNESYIEKIRLSASEVSRYLRNNRVSFADARGYKYIRSFIFLRKLKLAKPFAKFFNLLISSIEFNLRGEHPLLFLLDIYKVGFLCHYYYKK
ncbi:MAG: glycosyltransferase [Bacteroidales bacterium]|nr:glycosyltransferase [Bacteroidales bacterium]